jgi:DnaJ-class molecular chaperone
LQQDIIVETDAIQLVILTDSKGYYAILAVPENASYHEIKHSYRKLARKYHPDRNSSAHAEEMIKKINAAFEILSDSDKRSEYDKNGFAAIYEPEPEPDIHVNVRAASRPEQETVFADFFGGPYYLDTPKGRFHIIVEPSLCMAFGSCETLAPKVFSVEKNRRVNPKAKVECETCAEYDKIYAAAATCPTKAIKIIDRYTGEQMYP